MKAGRQALIDIGIPMPPTESADSFYLVLLTEVGPLGFILFFLFFGRIVMIALRAIREVTVELKPLLIGIVAGLASVTTQMLADDPLAGHATGSMLWLFAALILAIARYTQAEAQPSTVRGRLASGSPHFRPDFNPLQSSAKNRGNAEPSSKTPPTK
jgi:hypothetical protein